jgi:hypothetical protein
MKFFRLFAIFAVVLTLIIFSGPSLAQYNNRLPNRNSWQNDRNSCLVRKWDRQQPPDVFPELPENSVLRLRTTHIAAITRTNEEFDFQRRAFENTGLGPWLETATIDVPATYCGRPIQLQADVLLTEDFLNTPGFFEIFRDFSKDRNFFSDYYKIHGPSLLYFGLEAVPGVSYEEVLAFLQEQNISIVFHTEALGAIIDFIRVGYAYAEIVTPLPTTN